MMPFSASNPISARCSRCSCSSEELMTRRCSTPAISAKGPPRFDRNSFSNCVDPAFAFFRTDELVNRVADQMEDVVVAFRWNHIDQDFSSTSHHIVAHGTSPWPVYGIGRRDVIRRCHLMCRAHRLLQTLLLFVSKCSRCSQRR